MKILIIRFSSIGDIVLTSPVIRCLHEQLGAEIHYLTKVAYREILLPNPHIKQVWALEKSLADLFPKLREERFDCIVDLHKNLRSTRVRAALGVKAYTFDKLNPQKWLLVNFKIDLLPDLHIVDRYMATVTPLGVTHDNKGLDFFPSESDEKEAGHYLNKLREQHLGNKDYTALVIGAQYATKVPSEKWLTRLVQQVDGAILLIGGSREKDKGERIAQAGGPLVHNAAGALSLGASAVLVREAAAVISPDTGMIHIAAAFQQKIISIWGNTVPKFGMGPFLGENGTGQVILIENKKLPCRPCSKIGYGQCPRGHFDCMEKLSPEQVAVKLIQLKKDFDP